MSADTRHKCGVLSCVFSFMVDCFDLSSLVGDTHYPKHTLNFVDSRHCRFGTVRPEKVLAGGKRSKW